MAKETPPKNTALESDILKAAGTAGPALDQQQIKDQAQAITNEANKAQDIPGKTETMQGEPGQGVQLLGSNMPPVATSTAGIPGEVDPDYLEYLEFKKKKWVAEQMAADRKSTEYQEQQKREAEAEEAARKAYEAVMKGQADKGMLVETDATKVHNERLRLYGQGYVIAKRLGVEQIFTRQTWQLLGGRNNQDGYTEVVATPPEIANLKKG